MHRWRGRGRGPRVALASPSLSPCGRRVVLVRVVVRQQSGRGDRDAGLGQSVETRAESAMMG